MEASIARLMPADETIFTDGLGDRVLIRDAAGKPLHESLLIRPELCAVPSFEFSLNKRLTQLEQFDHPSFVRVRRLERVPGALPRLSVISDYSGGTRLSEVLSTMESSNISAPPAAVLFVVRDILDAVSALHRQSTDIAHGALSPERVVLNGKIRITDYVLGSAIEQLRFSPERYWKELRVAVPASAGASRLDRRADVAQIGMIALALFAGRPLRDSEHMGNVADLLAGLLLPDAIRQWLTRMVHLDPRRSYVSAVEGAKGLEEAITESGLEPVPLVLSALGVRTQRVTTTVRPVQPKPAPPTVAVKKPVVRTAPKQDPWSAHDVDHREYAGQGQMASGNARAGVFGKRVKMVVKIGLLGAALAGAFTAAQYVPAPAMFAPSGTLSVESNPTGVAVFVDSKDQGKTPLTLKLKSGKHQVELRGTGKPRVFNVFISSGAEVSQYVEMRASRPTARSTK
jgi:serine/threonine protein kinase